MATEEITTTDPPGIRQVIIGRTATSVSLTPYEKINLELHITDANFRDLNHVMQLLLQGKKKNIQYFVIHNNCMNIDNFVVCLDFFIKFILDNNETTRFCYCSGFEYTNIRPRMNLTRSRQLAEAIRSNHGQIEEFTFLPGLNGTFTTLEGFQLVWDSLFQAGVKVLYWHLDLDISTEDDDDDDDDDDNGNNNDDDDDDNNNSDDDNDNNNDVVQQQINLESFSTNTTLRELTLHANSSVLYNSIDWPYFFDAIKSKQRLESLHIDGVHFEIQEVLQVMLLQVIEMLRENNSLTQVCIADDDEYIDINDDSKKKINNLLEINRGWKKYKAMDDDDDDVEGVNDDTDADANTDADEDNEEKKILKFKKKTLVHMYVEKPMMRDTIIFILLKDYKLVLLHDANFIEERNETGIILLPITVWR